MFARPGADPTFHPGGGIGGPNSPPFITHTSEHQHEPVNFIPLCLQFQRTPILPLSKILDPALEAYPPAIQ